MTDRSALPDIELRRERTFGQVISDTLSVLGSNLGTFLPALFVVSAAPLLLLIVALTLAGPLVGGMVAGLAALPFFWVMLAATFAYFLLYEDGFFAEGGTLSPGVLWATSKPLIGPIVSVQLVTMLVFFGPAALIGGVAASQEWWPVLIVLFVVWIPLMFVMIPGIAMAIPAAVMEGEGPVGAVKRGVALAKDYWGQTFGVYLIASLLAGVFGFPFSMAGSFVGLFVEGTVGSGLYGLLTAIGYLGYTVLFGALLVQYLNLVERKEGGQLDARIEEIGMDEDDEAPLF